jgi:hypothetical protein
MKRKFNIYGHQFHQYQQTKQSLPSATKVTEHKKDQIQVILLQTFVCSAGRAICLNTNNIGLSTYRLDTMHIRRSVVIWLSPLTS